MQTLTPTHFFYIQAIMVVYYCNYVGITCSSNVHISWPG